MTSLEAAIREAAASGRLTHTSIVRDPGGRGWQANAPSRYGEGWAVAIRPDPVDALLAALADPRPIQPPQGVFD